MRSSSTLRLLIASVTVVLSVAASISVAFACTCFSDRRFFDFTESAVAVVRARAIAWERHGVIFQVNHVYRGNEARPAIIVWGDNGADCRFGQRSFPVGSEFILALDRERIGQLYEHPSDYAVSTCGQTWLRVVDGYVHLNTDREPLDRVTLDEFASRFSSTDE